MSATTSSKSELSLVTDEIGAWCRRYEALAQKRRERDITSVDQNDDVILCVECRRPAPANAKTSTDPRCRRCFKQKWTWTQRQTYFKNVHPGCDLCGYRPTNSSGLCFDCFTGTYGPDVEFGHRCW